MNCLNERSTMEEKIKILILEDFPPDVELIKRELKKAGIKMSSVRVDNQKDYISQINDYKPDLIISDYSLPQYDGITAIQDLRKISPEIPIIIVTGSLDEETAADTIKSGAWDYVVKERLYRLPTAVRQSLELKKQIADKLKAEIALHKTEDEFETLRNNVPLALFRTNTEGKLLYANPAFLKMFAYSSFEEALKIPVPELYVRPSERDELMKQLKQNGVVKNFQLECRRHNGEYFWGSFNIQAIFNKKGEHIFQDGIISDVTELKKVHEELVSAKERAVESDKLKTAFLANMSHEIRTPMNAIIGFSDLLSDESLTSKEIQDFISHIQRNSETLLKIISDIIDIAKIESGLLKVDKRVVDLNEVINEVESTFKHSSKNADKGVKFIVNKPTDEKLLIKTDPERVKQIITNLLTNAFKFTEKGKVELGCKLMDNEVLIYVKDTGLGIPEEKKQIIFERFRQVDDSHTREFGGTGLGLTIAKSLVEKMGGKIGLESQLYKGSNFYFTIPREEIDEEKELKSKIPLSIDELKNAFVGKKILIAEDVDSNYIYLETVLKSSGAKVIRALDGNETLEKLEQNPDTDIILMDIQMPNLNGYEATRIIRKFNQDIPIIAQTAYALSADRSKIIESGCNDYLIKPIGKSKLYHCLMEYIG